MNFLKNKTILITGGTGSFETYSRFLTKKCQLKNYNFSRDENKQYEMQKNLIIKI